MNKIFGGKVEKKSSREDGQFTINVDTSSLLFWYRTFYIIKPQDSVYMIKDMCTVY
jgi:GMP synthase-like glutamine amidotransferase